MTDTQGPQGERGKTGATGGFRFSNPQLVAFLIVVIGFGASLALNNRYHNATTEKVNQQGEASRKAIVKSGDAISVTGCNRDYDTIDTLRDELEKSADRVHRFVREGTLSVAQGERQIAETRDLLKRYKLPDCRQADEILTSNPKAKIVVPKARYPDDPQQLKDEAGEPEHDRQLDLQLKKDQKKTSPSP